VPDYVPRSNPPEISDATRKLWQAADERFKAAEEAKDYLKGTGKYTQAELDKLDDADLRQHLHDEALRQQVGNTSSVAPEHISEWLKAENRFEDAQQARNYLVGTGRWGQGEIDKMTDADLKAAIDTHAGNALLGHDSAVNPATTQSWIDAENRYRASQDGKGSGDGTGGTTSPGDRGGRGRTDRDDTDTDIDTTDTGFGTDPFVDDTGGGNGDGDGSGGGGGNGDGGGTAPADPPAQPADQGGTGGGTAPADQGGTGGGTGGGEGGDGAGSAGDDQHGTVEFAGFVDENGNIIEGNVQVADDVYVTQNGTYVHGDGTELTQEEIDEFENTDDDDDDDDDDAAGGGTEYTPNPDGEGHQRAPTQEDLDKGLARIEARRGWDTDPSGEDDGVEIDASRVPLGQQVKPVDPIDPDDRPLQHGDFEVRPDFNGNDGATDPVPDGPGSDGFGEGAHTIGDHAIGGGGGGGLSAFGDGSGQLGVEHGLEPNALGGHGFDAGDLGGQGLDSSAGGATADIAPTGAADIDVDAELASISPHADLDAAASDGPDVVEDADADADTDDDADLIDG
jgi:hypothetical protein